MAYQVGQACYSTAIEAAQASASAQAGAVVSHGGTAYVIDVAGVAESSITYRLQPLSGGAAMQATVAYTAQPCGLLQVHDGLSMGWMVGGAWVMVYALTFLARVLIKGETNDGDA